ncbi:hypothetical protein [Haladaptatus sp. ZSTT2]|uniref:hypothetical protein n=1 Tax=Haladaptatus sp. ZSTT2 TaxID=3120515 RepID=UPI00300F42B1
MQPFLVEGLTSPPTILLTLVLLAAIVLVGRILLHVAWKLILIAIAIIGALWIVGIFL